MIIETIGLHLWKASPCRLSSRSIWSRAVRRIASGDHIQNDHRIDRLRHKNLRHRLVNAISARTFISHTLPTPQAHFDRLHSLSLIQARQLWTRSSSIKEADIEKEESKDRSVQAPPHRPRFSFYTSATGPARYTDSLSDISGDERIWGMLTPSQNGANATEMEESSHHSKDNQCCWLDVTCPTVAEIEQLSRKLGLHALTTEDILGKETQEKLEIHPNYSFISYSAFNPNQQSPEYLQPVNVYILCLPHITVSIRSRPLTLTAQMEKRLARLKESVSITPDWIAYALIDEVTDTFAPAIKPIQISIEALSESLMVGKSPTEMLRSIAGARKKVMTLRRLMGSKIEVVKAMIKRHNRSPGMPQTEMSLNLSDVEDHLIAVAQDLNHWEEVISHSENNCLMQLNLQMTQANNDASEAISKLTVLSTVILPLNVITGLWGMNVQVPGQGIESLHYFGGLASLMVVVAFSGYLWATRFLRKKKR